MVRRAVVLNIWAGCTQPSVLVMGLLDVQVRNGVGGIAVRRSLRVRAFCPECLNHGVRDGLICVPVYFSR